MISALAEAERAHAVLSASGSGRWLACPPSARLEEQFPAESSTYAEEGTVAHGLAEMWLANHLGHEDTKTFYARWEQQTKHELYSLEMQEHVDSYLVLAVESINAARARTKDAIVLLEQRLDFSPWVPDGFGRGDLVIITDGVLEIIDFKYGKGVPVSAEDNTQMQLYALGAVNQFSLLYDFDTIRMTICQPRLDSISSIEIPVWGLLLWAEETVKPRAELAYQGKGSFTAGSHCRFCRAKHTCRARAEANLNLVRFEFLQPPLLSHEEIAEVLFAADNLQKWVTDVQAYALDQAENHGVKFAGWKLVEGRSVRKYADENRIAIALTQAGYDENTIYTQSLLGITAMEKALGKKRFGELLNELIIKPAGKPTLVPESDKRPEISSVASAAEDFKHEEEGLNGSQRAS